MSPVRFFIFSLLLLVLMSATAFAGVCQTGDPFPYTSPYENTGDCPAELQAWMDRANSCGHFMGEEAYDDERRDFLKEQISKLGCATLGCDFNKLFAEYEGDIVYTGILTGYAEHVFADVDNLPLCPDGAAR